ncbi:hypothetical protein [Vibrio cyclitrophicus]|uniref:hypothetical protein n=1 Tax=Vibrio cyclitrophicus TaxID=47951 RepID=UPI000CAE2C04|nr:hypothetical protein [Vibrio cyclitrophicus]PMJ73400.1 hypothetical protein BCU15_04410 [Vibrio cyclitrophicus]
MSLLVKDTLSMKKGMSLSIVFSAVLYTFAYHFFYKQVLTFTYWSFQGYNRAVYILVISILTSILAWKTFNLHLASKKQQEHFLRLSKIANSSLGTTILTGLSITWASYVSLYASELRHQLSSFNFSFESFIFVVTISLALFIAILKEIGAQHQAKDTERRIKDEYSALPPQPIINLISTDIITHNRRTSLLKNLSREVYDAGKLPEDVFNRLIQSIEKAIEKIVQDILKSTKTWDNETNSDLTYHVNFFHLFDSSQLLKELKSGELSDEFKESINSSEFFLFSDSTECKLRFCEYILVGARNYSTCDDGKEKSPICMPFSSKKFENSNEYVQPNLPGAPDSLYTQTNAHIGDTVNVFRTFRDEIEDSGHLDLTKRYLNGIKTYYSSSDAKSLLSIPIVRHENAHTYDSKKANSYIGVINIYANKKHMFKTQQKADAFHAIMNPLFYNLATLMSMQIEMTNHSLTNTITGPSQGFHPSTVKE